MTSEVAPRRRKPRNAFSYTACFGGLGIDGHPHAHITITRFGENSTASAGGFAETDPPTDWFSMDDALAALSALAEHKTPKFTVVGREVFQPGNLNILVVEPEPVVKDAVNAIHMRFGQLERDGKFYSPAERSFHVSGKAEVLDRYAVGDVLVASEVKFKVEGPHDPYRVWSLLA